MKLSEMFEHAPALEITGIASDSRSVKPGDMYFCIEGMENDGHHYIDQAIENGAVSIVHRKDLSSMSDGIAYIKVNDVNATLNIIASKFYGYPSKQMKIFGITGTNGKSSIASIIADTYSHFAPCGYIGTIAVSYGEVKKLPSLTTPDPISIHSTMKDMVDAGMKACALEVSSHGLELGRVQSVDFDVAIFSNLTYDHLDFHGTIDHYFAAKQKLFQQLKESGIAVLNIDDPYYQQLRDVTKAKIVTYGIGEAADYRGDDIHIGMNGSSFTLYHHDEVYRVETNLVALYNIYNLLAAIAGICESGIPLAEMLPFITRLQQIEGRMERIDEGQPFTVIVDFAHTPDGLTKVFEYAKTITDPGRSIIAVFGSAGKRDTKKRKVFGEIADRYCDLIILTEDDPRNEDAREIANEIKSGIQDTKNIYIENRYDAIRQAVETANVKDTVLILGKGDELFMYREDGREDWLGDHNAARHCIRKYYLGIEEENTK